VALNGLGRELFFRILRDVNIIYMPILKDKNGMGILGCLELCFSFFFLIFLLILFIYIFGLF
jgi:hypothetical protein